MSAERHRLDIPLIITIIVVISSTSTAMYMDNTTTNLTMAIHNGNNNGINNIGCRDKGIAATCKCNASSPNNGTSLEQNEGSLDALLYIVVVLFFYAFSIVVMMVKYIRRENKEANLRQYFDEYVLREKFQSPQLRNQECLKSLLDRRGLSLDPKKSLQDRGRSRQGNRSSQGHPSNQGQRSSQGRKGQPSGLDRQYNLDQGPEGNSVQGRPQGRPSCRVRQPQRELNTDVKVDLHQGHAEQNGVLTGEGEGQNVVRIDCQGNPEDRLCVTEEQSHVQREKEKSECYTGVEGACNFSPRDDGSIVIEEADSVSNLNSSRHHGQPSTSSEQRESSGAGQYHPDTFPLTDGPRVTFQEPLVKAENRNKPT